MTFITTPITATCLVPGKSLIRINRPLEESPYLFGLLTVVCARIPRETSETLLLLIVGRMLSTSVQRYLH